jgi:amino acid transporter
METTAPVRVTTLKSHSVNLWGAVAQSAALIGPAAGVTAGNIFVAGLSGPASPLAFVIGLIVCLSIAKVVGDYARQLPSAGSFYTYLTNTFGPKTGFVTGVLLFGAYIVLLPFQLSFFGFFTQNVVAAGGVHIPWQLFALALIALSTSLAVIGIRPSLTAGLIGLTFEMAVFTILSLLIIAHGGATGNSIQPFNPTESSQGVSGLLLACVFTIFAFVGFESATTLGEEARNPTHTIPRAVLLTTLLVGIFYVLVAYAEVIGFGLSQSGVHALQTDPIPFNTLALRYGNSLLSSLVNLATMSSFIALDIVTVTAASRMVYAMGRDGLLPRIFGRVNRRRSPHIASLAVGLFGVLSSEILGSIFGPENWASWAAFIATLFFIVAYVLLNAGVIKFYWQHHRSEFRWLQHIVFPCVGLAGMGLVLYGNVYPVPPAPLSYFIYLTAAIIIGAAIIAWWLEAKDPQAVQQAGQLFAAAEDVEVAAAHPGNA